MIKLYQRSLFAFIIILKFYIELLIKDLYIQILYLYLIFS